MPASRQSSESVLEELGLADGEFAADGSPLGDLERSPRLERTHSPIRVDHIIDEAPHQNRITTFDPERYPEDAELLESVRAHGVLEPVYLQRISFEVGEEVQYAPIAGHRRITAARIAGMEKIPAIIARREDDPGAIALAENMGHRALTAYEKAIGLTALKDQDPSLSLRGLALRSGIPFGTVSSLMSAYEKSSPALRGLFAEGVAPRAIQELQPVLSYLPEEAQVALVPKLMGITQAQARSFRRLVEKGADPDSAAKSAMGFPEAKSGDSPRKEDGPTLRSTGRSSGLEEPKGSRRGDRCEAGAPLHLPTDEAGMEVLHLRTGARRDLVEALTQAALREGIDYPTLLIACAYVAGGGDMGRAIELSGHAATTRTLKSTLLRHLRTVERGRRLISSSDDPEQRDFLERIFFGLPLYVDKRGITDKHQEEGRK